MKYIQPLQFSGYQHLGFVNLLIQEIIHCTWKTTPSHARNQSNIKSNKQQYISSFDQKNKQYICNHCLQLTKKKYNHCLFICVNVNIYFTISRILNAAKRLAVVNSRKICRGRRILLSNRVKIAGQLLEQHNGSIIHPKTDEPHISSSYVSSNTQTLSCDLFKLCRLPGYPRRFGVMSGYIQTRSSL